jgi:hypothetical protein
VLFLIQFAFLLFQSASFARRQFATLNAIANAVLWFSLRWLMVADLAAGVLVWASAGSISPVATAVKIKPL